MECPYCGSELIYTDYYGKTKYSEYYWIYPRSWIEKEGDIFKCQNSEGFEDLELAQEYKDKNDEFSEYNVENVCCNSSCFNGNFYTDSRDELHEGYPC